NSIGEMAQAYGEIKVCSKGEVEPRPRKTMPQIQSVERNYKQTYEKMTALGTNVNKGYGINGIKWDIEDEYNELKKIIGVNEKEGIAEGYPDITNARDASEAVLRLASTTNGQVAVKAWEALEEQ